MTKDEIVKAVADAIEKWIEECVDAETIAFRVDWLSQQLREGYLNVEL